MGTNDGTLFFGESATIKEFEWDCVNGVIRLGSLHLIIYSILNLLNSGYAELIYPERLKVLQVAMLILAIPYVLIFRKMRKSYNIDKTGLNWIYGVITLSWLNLVFIGLFTGFFRSLNHYLSSGRDLNVSLMEGVDTFLSHFLSRIPSITQSIAPIFAFAFGYIFIIHVLPNWKKHLGEFKERINTTSKQKNIP